MAVYFADSSALVKRYVKETGTRWMRRLTRKGAANHIYVARIAVVEGNLGHCPPEERRHRSSPRASSMLWRFRKHMAGRYTVVEITPALLADAAKLATTHALRAYDAVQLSAALTVLANAGTVGLTAITMVSADNDLNAAARAEGVAVENPNLHP